MEVKLRKVSLKYLVKIKFFNKYKYLDAWARPSKQTPAIPVKRKKVFDFNPLKLLVDFTFNRCDKRKMGTELHSVPICVALSAILFLLY
jgi:hypothetical protein